MPAVPYRAVPFVDVRDLAQAHLQAMKRPEAANKRFIASNETVWYKDLIGAVAEKFVPAGYPVPTTLAPRPDDFDDSSVIYLDNTASRTILQVQYRPYRETMIDMA